MLASLRKVLVVILLLLICSSAGPNFFPAKAAIPEGIKISELKQKYEDRKFRILIVPGHDDKAFGASFNDLKEADVTLRLAKDLAAFFKNDNHFKVFLARDDNGYLPELRDYFENRQQEILAFYKAAKAEVKTLLDQGKFTPKTVVDHNYASADGFIKLQGTNKWALDNDIDLAIHIHFNDYPGRPWNQPGKYSGLSIYIPEKQFPNYETSSALAQSIFSQLTRFLHANTNPVEKDGIIEDQNLIAIGANASLKNPSLLIEYGYLYEPPLASAGIRRPLLNEMAYQTYRGVKLYFDPSAETFLNTSSFLPRHWNTSVSFGARKSPEVLALQIALANENLFPAAGFEPSSCLLTGSFGPCTRAAVKSFQQKYELPATGAVGPLTLDTLNKIYDYRIPKSTEDFKYFWKTDLAYGLKNNEDVAALENALLLQGFYDGRITGNFSENTRDALMAFQKSRGLAIVPVKGFVGPQTRKILNDMYSK